MSSVAAEALGEAAAGRLAIEGAAEGLEARVEVVEVPAQAHAVGGPLGHEVLAVVDQELQLAQPRVVGGRRQARLSQGCPSNREGVDRVWLSDRAGSLSLPRGHPGADPHHRFGGAEEKALEAAVDVAAVLEREAQAALGGQPVGPGEKALVAFLRSGHGQLAEELSGRVFDRGGGVGVFVGVDSDRDQLRLLSLAVSSDGGAKADGTGWGF
jgi:hypothetical protein